ncbi:uncharacterized protein LOC114328185 [Diabrotica virgifera virgifera]|uniref:Uncharacterized protein LOC114328185 isoform X3 n=1 Tax=Diabrotica virgifera virgifera TaxID=50390 RepID=A0A6P7FB26_DIAVI|nr:uncharacterized protein LOC114328185 [Diabrotica virgifera virgifera]
MHVSSTYKLILLASIFKTFIRSDDYVDEAFAKCEETKDLLFCAKYGFVKYIDELTYSADWTDHSFVSARSNVNGNQTDDDYKGYTKDDDSYIKFYKFLRRKLTIILSNHYLAIVPSNKNEFPRGRKLDFSKIDYAKDKNSESARGHKKRRHLYIVPILMLTKMMKILILLGMVFSAMMMVKKLLILAAFLLPGIIRNIRTACRRRGGLLSNLI